MLLRCESSGLNLFEYPVKMRVERMDLIIIKKSSISSGWVHLHKKSVRTARGFFTIFGEGALGFEWKN